MRTALLVSAVLAGSVFAATPALADDPTAPPSSAFTITGSAGVWSQYRFRGISQSNNRPVFQGSATVSHASGFYLSAWGSSASAGNSTVNIGGTEIDVYGGYTHAIGKTGVTFDGGVYGYIYPGASAGNYYEVYASLAKTYGPVTAKVGGNIAPDQKVFDYYSGTNYNVYVYGELGFAVPGTAFSVHTHVGHTGGGFDYTKDYIDYTAGVSYKWKALTFDVSGVGTNVSHKNARNNPFVDQTGTPSSFQTYRAAKAVVVGSISASF
jgi:uncharacterized protein (TIGR02001 family)